VAAAQARGLDARVVDARELPFEAEFDAVFSNAALHWIRPPEAVIAGVWRGLEPGGRFVGEMGGAGNIASVVNALAKVLAHRGIDQQWISPWYFPDEAEYRGRLEQAGFVVTSMERFPRPTPLPGDVGDWLETFAGSFLGLFPADQRALVIDELRGLLRPGLLSGEGVWVLDYVRLRFAATKPWSDADERAYAAALADMARAAAV
jgi:SAM-dependent methyltransferase